MSKNKYKRKKINKHLTYRNFICVSGERKYKDEHCIKMTPEKHKEIETLVEKITAFLEKLAEEHEELDITHVNFDIEGHSDDEEEEKETILQVIINDCATVAEKEAEKDQEELKYREEVKKELVKEEKKVKENDETHKESFQKQDNDAVLNEENCNGNTAAVSKEQTSQSTIDSNGATQEQKEIHDLESNNHEPRVKPTLVYLNMSENGQEILKILEKKRGKKPVLVVLEQDNGKRRIFMPSTK